MINLQFIRADGQPIMAYDVKPGFLATVPPGATGVVVWLGTREAGRYEFLDPGALRDTA